MVYVISNNGQALMPTKRFGKVRRLLKEKKAKVIRRCPFTIKLLYETETCIVQDVVLGMDTGSKNIGVSCVANNEVLYQSQTTIRTDIKDNMDIRRKYRRNRRNRKTRYRKPRFLNRKNSTKLDRLPPSVRHKVKAHVDEIEFCKKILPISQIVLEISQFDPHLMKNPKLKFKKIKSWGYQRGFNYGFSSRKEAVLNRDSYTCQICGAKHTRLEVHHIVYRSKGGTDDEDNLITLCESCHKKIHTGEINVGLKAKKLRLKEATHMNIIRNQLLKTYPGAIETFGFVTKENRNNLNLPKDHYIDACVVAAAGKSFILNDEIFYKRRVSKGDYQLYKGSCSEIRLPIGKIQGFKKFDKVDYLGKTYFIKGRMSSGYAVLMDIFNKTIDFSDMPRGFKTPKLKNLKRVSARGSVLCIREKIG
ncbi:MAG: RNA-guided endonuclease IscB [Finegoldia sp.]|uniref:RNA-guided endonuclease IscB n=1 Tax=Finegoldia sp. TaxID=1981334 RepID=UPI003992FE6A